MGEIYGAPPARHKPEILEVLSEGREKYMADRLPDGETVHNAFFGREFMP